MIIAHHTYNQMCFLCQQSFGNGISGTGGTGSWVVGGCYDDGMADEYDRTVTVVFSFLFLFQIAGPVQSDVDAAL